MIINKSGIAIRMSVSEIRVAGRNTQGVRLIKLNETDEISSVTRIENEEAVAGEEGGQPQSETPATESNQTAEWVNGEWESVSSSFPVYNYNNPNNLPLLAQILN